MLQKRLTTNLIEKLGFKDGRDFVYWDSFDDLFEKLDLYLTNETLRDQTRWSGHKRVQKYSMTNQALKIEALILDKFYDRL